MALFEHFEAWLLLASHLLLAIASAGHALLYKRDPRAALGWMAVCLAYPFVGSLMYYLFGINRLRTRAHQIKGEPNKRLKIRYERPEGINIDAAGTDIPALKAVPELAALARSSAAVTHRGLLEGNAIEAYFDGESAYAAMLAAIDGARVSVCLATYIFETNRSGRDFIDALTRAQQRGVAVRVLLDGFGEFYSLPRAGTLLKRSGVRVARFIPPRLLPPAIHVNLRNHRKLLVVDGNTGFTGGMNIGDRHLAHAPPRHNTTADIHFRLEGPICAQLQDVFDEDWLFAAGRDDRRPAAPIAPRGNAICRVVTDGPNEDLGKLAMIINGAVALARRRVYIMTPYFLPPPEMVNTLQAAALRGIEVDIILPEKSNLPPVQWATRNMLWELLQYGVRVFYQPPPFAHSKLLIVDDDYAHIGSSNLDPRSLRLNFELVVEIFAREPVSLLAGHFQRVRRDSQQETLQNIDSRSMPTRLRDAAAWLFSPYL